MTKFRKKSEKEIRMVHIHANTYHLVKNCKNQSSGSWGNCSKIKKINKLTQAKYIARSASLPSGLKTLKYAFLYAFLSKIKNVSLKIRTERGEIYRHSWFIAKLSFWCVVYNMIIAHMDASSRWTQNILIAETGHLCNVCVLCRETIIFKFNSCLIFLLQRLRDLIFATNSKTRSRRGQIKVNRHWI